MILSVTVSMEFKCSTSITGIEVMNSLNSMSSVRDMFGCREFTSTKEFGSCADCEIPAASCPNSLEIVRLKCYQSRVTNARLRYRKARKKFSISVTRTLVCWQPTTSPHESPTPNLSIINEKGQRASLFLPSKGTSCNRYRRFLSVLSRPRQSFMLKHRPPHLPPSQKHFVATPSKRHRSRCVA
jgi:hypothetical protein